MNGWIYDRSRALAKRSDVVVVPTRQFVSERAAPTEQAPKGDRRRRPSGIALASPTL
jgi:hypothetical protein